MPTPLLPSKTEQVECQTCLTCSLPRCVLDGQPPYHCPLYQTNSPQAYHKRYREDHQAEIAAYKKRYRADHQAEIAAYHKRYCHEHRAEIAAYKKRYYQDQKGRCKVTQVDETLHFTF